MNAKGPGDKSDLYGSFLGVVSAFRKLGTIPVALHFEEDITVDHLVQHQAAWHKSCRLKFNQSKLDRAQKREIKNAETSTSGEKRPRRQSVNKMACLFCQQGTGHLHEFRTFGAEENIRQMAMQLKETDLLARVEGKD